MSIIDPQVPEAAFRFFESLLPSCSHQILSIDPCSCLLVVSSVISFLLLNSYHEHFYFCCVFSVLMFPFGSLSLSLSQAVYISVYFKSVCPYLLEHFYYNS